MGVRNRQQYVNVLSPRGSDKSGAFHLARVPQGDYKLMMNPFGSNKDSPYPPMYYRLAARLPDAQVLKVGEGQHIQDADFFLPPWRKRRWGCG